jgi:predicted transcriptional regulator
MKNKPLYILLSIIKRHSDARMLLHEGINYEVAGELLNVAFKEKLLVNIDNKLQVTEKGETLFQELSALYKKIDKKQWISPENKSRISKIDKNDIFLPSQDELKFLK